MHRSVVYQTPLITCLLLLLMTHCGLAQVEPPKPLRVRAQLTRPPYFVKQSVILQVSVIAEGERPSILLPKILDADVIPIGNELKQVSASGIGSLQFQRNQFITRYRIVPHRAGVLKIPAISARLVPRTGSSEPFSIPIENVPQVGRPVSFLGGVGAFEVTAESSAPSVRVGEVLDYRVRVTGPAALGMNQAPEIRRHPQLSLGLRIEPEPIEPVTEPPSRVFRYRLRPTRPGQFVIPPVTIAAFDPGLRRYITKVSSSVNVRVVDVHRFNPSSLKYPPPSRPNSAWSRRLILGSVGGGALIVGGAVGLYLQRWRQRRASRLATQRLLSRLLQEIESSLPAAETARRLTEGVAEYLSLTRARPRGVLTPKEAREGVALASRDVALGVLAEQLITQCDQAQYALEGPTSAALLEAAKRLFDALGREQDQAQVGKESREEEGEGQAIEKPREAVETANT